MTTVPCSTHALALLPRLLRVRDGYNFTYDLMSGNHGQAVAKELLLHNGVGMANTASEDFY